MAFFRQEYWSGLSFPPPGDLPDPGIGPNLLHWQVDSFPLSHLGSPTFLIAASYSTLASLSHRTLLRCKCSNVEPSYSFLFPGGNQCSWMHLVLYLQTHLLPDVYHNYFSILRSSFSSWFMYPADNISISIFNWHLKFHMSKKQILNHHPLNYSSSWPPSVSKHFIIPASWIKPRDHLRFLFFSHCTCKRVVLLMAPWILECFPSSCANRSNLL